MICVTVNKDLYRYEINALFRAFWPEQEVQVIMEGTGPKRQAEKPEILFQAGVVYRPDQVELSIPENPPTGPVLTFTPLPEEMEEFAEGTAVCDEKSHALKTALKHMLYRALSQVTGKKLPWGELIGIRPTKLAMEVLENGGTEEQAVRTMMTEHKVSEEKAVLSAQIAEREKEILSRIHFENGYSLYVNIPFCPTTCLYCSFTSFPISAWQDRVDSYLDVLEREMRETSAMMKAQGKVPDTIYIGGGTPTTLSPAQSDRLLTMISRYFTEGGPKPLEFTVEAGRPDSITAEKVRVLKAHGVTRMSVNPQTMNDRTLRLIGRRHTVQQTIEAYRCAREAGMDNINMDIILGLPGESAADVQHTVDEIVRLSPDDFTVHSLALKRASRMMKYIEENGFSAISNTDETMRIASEGAARMGLVPYYLYRQKNMSGNFENVGYARPEKRDENGNILSPARYGIYNILIMEEKQTILALGAGAITKRVWDRGENGIRIERCENAKEIDVYMNHIDEMLERKRKLFGLDSKA
ncbi:MAG: coproporphyrinogen dehydrogenase HemZ [Lachnospiraceae bacterium]|jgi:coproporphyrinogen dehydrogenase HemZ